MTKSCAAPSLATRFLLLLFAVEPCDSLGLSGVPSAVEQLWLVHRPTAQRAAHSRETCASTRYPSP